MELRDIVMKLTGDVRATGEEYEDMKRYENLINLLYLMRCLILEIRIAADDAESPEKTKQLIGNEAQRFFDTLRDNLQAKGEG